MYCKRCSVPCSFVYLPLNRRHFSQGDPTDPTAPHGSSLPPVNSTPLPAPTCFTVDHSQGRENLELLSTIDVAGRRLYTFCRWCSWWCVIHALRDGHFQGSAMPRPGYHLTGPRSMRSLVLPSSNCTLFESTTATNWCAAFSGIFALSVLPCTGGGRAGVYCISNGKWHQSAALHHDHINTTLTTPTPCPSLSGVDYPQQILESISLRYMASREPFSRW